MERETAETAVLASVQWLRLGMESFGALIIAVGLVVSVATIAREMVAGGGVNFTRVRITFARYLALALEFQLGADILSTSVAPTWDQIGKLAAIAVIRTALNYFLTQEMRSESAEIEEEELGKRDAAGRAQRER